MRRFIVLVSALLFSVSCHRADPAVSTPTVKERPPEEVVQELGHRMKQVSTTASPEIAAKAIREAYSGLVHPRLLEAWVASPAEAPGRPVSSPWPERIEITRSTHSSNDATVRGVLVEATSTGEGPRTPVLIHLQRVDGSWLITDYATQESTLDESQAAVSVIHDYYDAIAKRDFEKAYGYWGSTGPLGQTLESFAAGFADTATVTVKTGKPSRVEPAAGSRYVEVPVTITATTKAGETQRFEGTYTLRRSVVEGAAAANAKWHIHKASIRKIAG